MQLRALIFDFDGVILETETPEYHAWVEVFSDYQVDLPIGEWQQCVGADYNSFDPMQFLASKTSQPLDLPALHARQRMRSQQIVLQKEVMPGVLDLLKAARAAGIRTAVASSSSDKWVLDHLERLGLRPYFDVVCTSNLVERIKPHPDLYLLAIQKLDVTPGEAVAIEDSLNGLRAARAAGLFCIVIPNPVTESLDFTSAQVLLPSLADTTLEYLNATLESSQK